MADVLNPQVDLKGSDAGTGEPQDMILRRAQSHVSRMHNFRRQYDSRRAAHYRMFVGQRDQKFFPDNLTKRSNTFVPYPLSNVRTLVSRTLDAFFSFEPSFEVRGKGAADEPKAEAMQLVMHDRLRRANYMQAIEALVYNLCIYDVGAIKVDWDWEFDMVVDPQPELLTVAIQGPDGQTIQVPVPDPQTGAPIVKRINPVTRPVPRSRPKFVVIDPYDLLIDPDGGLVAHCTEKTFGQLLREQEGSQGQLYMPEGLEAIQARLQSQKDPDDVLIRLVELWDERTGSVTLMTYSDSEAIYWKDLRAAYRNANLSGFKRKLFGGPSVLLFHGPNPFGHKRAPILHTSYIKLTGEPYGMGAVEIIADLSEALNTFINMVVDNWNLGINRRYAYSVDADIDHTALNSFNVPGGKVGVTGDPNKVLAPLPMFTPSRQDYAILEVYKGMIEMTSGISDFYAKGLGSPSGNKTATGISQVINESNFQFRMFIRNLEVDVLRPLLEMTASLIQQYVTDPIEVRITDAPAAIEKWPIVTPEQLIGNFDFELAAANYASNKILRQRNILAWANLAVQSPFLNQHELLKELAKIFEIRNINRILYTPEQVAQMQQAQLEQEVKMMMLESALQTESKARLAQAKPQPAGASKGAGRPRGVQKEGKIPGAGLTSFIREMAQSVGANASGLSGMGEVNEN